MSGRIMELLKASSKRESSYGEVLRRNIRKILLKY